MFTGYIGTYTKGTSEGVYSFTLDTEKGELARAEVAAPLINPTYVTISDNERFAYAVSPGGLTAYEVNKVTGELTLINSISNKESSPCHVSIDPTNQYAAAAYYHDGTVVLYKVDPDTGRLLEQLSVAQQVGNGPNKDRQEAPHMHFSGFTPDGKFLVGVDLGTDEIVTYEYKEGNLNDVQRRATPPGSGPRHVAFHPQGLHAYAMTELSNEVLVLRYNEVNGSFDIIKSITAIPDDFKDNSQGSAIHISSDGRFVYAGNRGHDSIVVYKVDQVTNELELVEYANTGGNWPRDFVLDPSEKFLIATNQESGNVVLFKRDAETGKLTETDSVIQVPDPVCVKFLK
ncbi:lactonase family protein [Jeotgalibacillus marinus]|uniref:Lactonase family protein n=1 Tax=Jeotgalibacillus marinus TaxID=86667 RepID=A0ABV3Q5N9_9BACL